MILMKIIIYGENDDVNGYTNDDKGDYNDDNDELMMMIMLTILMIIGTIIPCLAEVFPPSKEKKKKPLHGSARFRPKVWTNKLTQNWFKTRYNQFEF